MKLQMVFPEGLTDQDVIAQFSDEHGKALLALEKKMGVENWKKAPKGAKATMYVSGSGDVEADETTAEPNAES